MAQCIKFASIPNTQPIGYAHTIQLILGEIRRSRPEPKTLREFLRMRNLFDKEGFPVLMEMLDVRIGAVAELGPTAVRLLDAEDEPACREVMATRLIDLNPLLAKYCLEALDTEKGGRLHSTNELYRMITSYVYPGEKPTLPSFRSWVDWAAASGLIKVVGIRWALGERGLQVLPRLRAIDAEEFLEAESEAAPELEHPAETTPVTEEIHEETNVVTQAPIILEAPPPARKQVTQLSQSSLATTRDRLVEWFASYPNRRVLNLASVGLSAGRKPSLIESAFAAFLLGRGLSQEQVAAAMESLRTTNVFQNAAKGKLSLQELSSLLARANDKSIVTATELCVHLYRLAIAVSKPEELFRINDPRELLWCLWKRLYEPFAPLAPFIFARFCLETGHINSRLSSVAFVPWYTTRENAFRIGFIEKIHAGTFSELLDIALELVEFFPAPSFEGPLHQVHEAFGCSFRCAKTALCPFMCREKSEIT